MGRVLKPCPDFTCSLTLEEGKGEKVKQSGSGGIPSRLVPEILSQCSSSNNKFKYCLQWVSSVLVTDLKYTARI